MASGFFLGGAAEGMTSAQEQQRKDLLAQLEQQKFGLEGQKFGLAQLESDRNYGINTQKLDLSKQALGLHAQAQSFGQQRQLIAEAEGQVANTMKIVADTIAQGRAVNADPEKIMATVSPLIQNAGGIYQRIGRDPSILQKQAQAMLTQPTGEEAATAKGKQAAIAAAPTATKVEKPKDAFGNESIVFANPITQTATRADIPGMSPNDNPAKGIADAVRAGLQPPDLKGLYRQGGAVRAQLAQDGFDLSRAQQEWESAHKQILSLNGPQMVRYAGLATSVVNTIDRVKELSQQLQLGGVPIANKAELTAFIQAAGNSEKGQLATKYMTAVGVLQEEMANLVQGGYAPTESAWDLALKQVNGNYGVKQLDASLGEVQRLVRYRLQGIPNFQTLGPNAPNRYFNSGQSGHGDASPPPSIPAPPPGFVIK